MRKSVRRLYMYTYELCVCTYLSGVPLLIPASCTLNSLLNIVAMEMRSNRHRHHDRPNSLDHYLVLQVSG